MKTCSKCKESLPLVNFRKKKKGSHLYQSKCIECNKEYQKEHYRKNKEDYYLKSRKHREKMKDRIRTIKQSKPCADCGIKYHYCQMDFDHIRDKTGNISSMVGHEGYSWATIQKEISKCELVCSNCHRLRTFNRQQDIIKLAGL